jgi:F-type H+-transporting ATPase subunit epsilon
VKSSFTLRLQDATRAEEITGVASFVGEDASGSFGILAGHARMLTALVTGLARFRVSPDNWQYLAVPGALLYFQDNVLTLSTRRYLLDTDYTRISQALQQQLLAEEEKLHAMTTSLHRMEEAMLKRLWDMGRRDAG